jgi:precorrin-2 dehydrogenase/sirohydrochlorin ferrochelatase
MSGERDQRQCRRYYPILLDLADKKVLVVGGGNVAQRKIETLLDHGARVEVIAQELNPAIASLVERGSVRYAGADFSETCLDKVFLVVAATSDASLNRRVSEKAQQRGLLINAVDQPSDCNFIVPSVLRRGDMVVAVSTSGKSPAFARKVREDLEGYFGDEFESFLILMGNLRELVLSLGFHQEKNKEIFENLISSRLLRSVRDRNWEEAAAVVNEILGRSLAPEDVMAYARKESG